MISRVPVFVLHGLLVVAAVFLVYAPALDYGFVWDDNLYVVGNGAVQDWGRVGEAFTSPRTSWSGSPEFNISEWRPLRNVSYLVDHSLYGLNPMGWHLTNIVLHGLTGVLVLLLLRRLVGLAAGDGEVGRWSGAVCLVAVLGWALHPVQTEVVAWVKSRDDLLATPFMVGALVAVLPRRGDEGWSVWGLLGGVVLFVGGLLSKENAVVLAGVLPLLVLMLFGVSEATVRRWFVPVVVFGVVGVVFLGARDLLLGRTSQADWPGSAGETVLTMLHAFGKYVQLICWPWPPVMQSVDYDGFGVVGSWRHPGALAGGAVLLGMAAVGVACWAGRRNVLVAVGMMMFFVALLPFANVVPMMQIMAERFLYVPMIGLAVVVVGAFGRSDLAGRRRVLFWIMAGLVVAALAVQTRVRLPVWGSEVALFGDARRANPGSWRPADHYVKALIKEGRMEEALGVARGNLQRWPRDPDIVRTAALAYLVNDNEEAGVALTGVAVSLQPDDYRASVTLEKWRVLKAREGE